MFSKHKKEIIIGIILVVVCLGIFIYRWSDRPGLLRAQITDVAVVPVQTIQLQIEYAAAGTIKAAVSSQVAAQVTAKVVAVYVKPGDKVSEGQTLANLDAVASNQQALASLNSSQAAGHAVVAATERLNLAELTLARYEKLMQENAIARQEYDRVLNDRDIAQAQYAQALANQSSAKASAGSAAANAAYYTIKAPVNGVVAEKFCDLGDMVSPGKRLFVVDSAGQRQVEIAVDESLQGKIKVGDEVRIIIEGNNQPQMAKISEVGQLVDPASRTFMIKADLSANSATLPTGQYVKAFVPTGGSRQAIVVPQAAIIERGELSGVYVVNKDNTVLWRIVKLGDEIGDQREILSGLDGGEDVAVSNLDKLYDGARLRL